MSEKKPSERILATLKEYQSVSGDNINACCGPCNRQFLSIVKYLDEQAEKREGIEGR